MTASIPRATNFVEGRIVRDLTAQKVDAIVTRFPPEPNGYLHIGHAKSICLNFGLAEKFGGRCNLRFDDTNPSKEEQEFVNSIQEDIRWLGFDWGETLFASDYFEQLYQWAVQLVKQGDAYVCELDPEQTRSYRGTLTEPGKNSPWRDRSIEENLDLLARMKAGEFPDGSRTLRAKIEMTSPNLNLRDPVMYRIMRAHHHRTGDEWCIYPMYDWAHGQSDSIEGITHSVCTLEFENHRPLYDWFIEKLGIHHPQQIEFGRLNLTHTVMSKRKLRQLVEEGHVSGWDDPRMPTLSAFRRRGVPAETIRAFCDRIGVSKNQGAVELALLEAVIREDLNRSADRISAVLDPIRLVLTNYPPEQTEELTALRNPEDPSAGQRILPLCRELYIEREDFHPDPPKKYFRLSPGKEVRLRKGYIIKCEGFDTDADGRVTEVRATYDPETKSGTPGAARKVKGTIHWVSARHGVQTTVRLYDTLFTQEDPEDLPEGGSFLQVLNPDSLVEVEAILEPGAADLQPGDRVQFMRNGYFAVDPESTGQRLVFNRIVTLKDSWEKARKKKG